MEEASLVKILNAFAARIVVLECQSLAAQKLLEKAGIATEAQFDQMVAKIYAQAKDMLDPRKDDAARLAEFLQKYEGPTQ
jgi:hypothetical protein